MRFAAVQRFFAANALREIGGILRIGSDRRLFCVERVLHRLL